MRRTILILSLFVAAATLTASSAFAQAPATTASGAASGHGRGIGLGAMTMLNGVSGLLVTWGSSGGGFHLDGFAGLHHYNPGAPNNTTDFSVGGRFWYHLHAASFADFSLGGGVGIIRWVQDPGGGGESDNLDVSLEVGGQIRAFIVPNVALLADLGVGATFGGNDNILIGGQTVTGAGSPEGGSNFAVGTLGIAYFFE
jgi:hypothetical protein